MTTIHAVDLYAGGGGTSTGLALACKELGLEVDLTAINHWKEAVETHKANHPWANHLCMEVEQAIPRKIVKGGHLDILVASPSCVYHSRAAGGRPKNEQDRASPWHILRWLEELDVDSLLVENVPEFSGWGPLDAEGNPIKELKGTTYRAWLMAVESLGYTVEARVLNAADYGAPTSRSRIFVAARKGEATIRWPKPTHRKEGKGRRRWRPAKEIIDWSIEGKSIFTRKKPLSPNTIRRIVEGLKRFGGEELQPFIIQMEHGGSLKDMDKPLPTITTAKGGSMAVVRPEAFLLSQGSNGAPKAVSRDPVPAILTGGKHAFVQPFILSQASGGAPRPVDKPAPTITGGGAHALVDAFIIPHFGERKTQRPRTHSIDDPLPAATSHGAGSLVSATIIKYHSGRRDGGRKRAYSVEEPLKTIDTSNRLGIARSFILPVEGFHQEGGRTHNPARSVETPLGTITQRGYGGVVQPFLAEYYGNSAVQSVDEPLPTVPTKDKFALVQPVHNGFALDIKFRMLEVHELAAAMQFPKSYIFMGTKAERIKQIGNAVVVGVAYKLTRSLLEN